MFGARATTPRAAPAGRVLGLYAPTRAEGRGATGVQVRNRQGPLPHLQNTSGSALVKLLPRALYSTSGSGTHRGVIGYVPTHLQRQRPLSLLWSGRYTPGATMNAYNGYGGIAFRATGAQDYGLLDIQNWVAGDSILAVISYAGGYRILGSQSSNAALAGLQPGDLFAVAVCLSPSGEWYIYANGRLAGSGTNNDTLVWHAETAVYLNHYGTGSFSREFESTLLALAGSVWPRAYCAALTRHPEALWSGARAGLLAEAGAQSLAPVLDVSAGAWFVQAV